MNKIEIRGVFFDDVDMAEALALCEKVIAEPGSHRIHTPNSEIVQLCVEDPGRRALINSADIVVPDGAGVVMASKILGKPLKKGKVAGVEICENLVRLSGEKGWKIFLLGGKPDAGDGRSVAQTAADNLKIKYPDALFAGCRDGYFKDDAEVVNEINASGADILFVCLGVPKQEEWMYAHRDDLKVSLMGGFGGSLDVFAGTVNRAPDFYVRHGLEWFYRLIKQPSRIGRMMKLPKFILGAVKDKIIRKKY